MTITVTLELRAKQGEDAQTITIDLTEELEDRLVILASMGKSIDEQIIRAITEYLDRHELNPDKKRWSGDAPEQFDTEQRAEVYVTTGQETSISSNAASDGKAMAQALAKLAEFGSVSNTSDPLDWQRQQREERALPGRNA